MTLDTQSKQGSQFRLLITSALKAIICLCLDILFIGNQFVPFFCYGFLYYAALSNQKSTWSLWALIFGITLSLAQNLPLSYYLISFYLCCVLTALLKPLLQSTRFINLWILYGVVLILLMAWQQIWGLLIFGIWTIEVNALKYVLTWSLLPVQIHLLRRSHA